MTDKIYDYRINQTKDVAEITLPDPHYVRVHNLEIRPSEESDKSQVRVELCTFAGATETTACPNAPEIPSAVFIDVLDADLKGNDSIDVVVDNYIRGPYLEAAYTAGNIVKQ